GGCDQAVEEAETLVAEGMMPGWEQTYSDLAMVYGRALAHVAKNEHLSEPQRAELKEQYGRRAVAILVLAEQSGYYTNHTNREELRNDEDFEPLHDRPDFQELRRRAGGAK